ncbi:hypothetical protein [Desulfofundulus thermocisternus]|uniref:hypothetical protein n=1 Tax=Desulfofundulus thermocisternus TaxID=42471 RepID=UPI0019D94E5B|nr:hypothetical protein [Desulfofundulus thermocisternus]MBE3586361.1 hypothetical protein [Thermoanaerobacter sp.]MCS5697325.1 hypothetical protein [Desulfofundulus thermocisternus]
MSQRYGFRRARTKLGYRKIQADIYMPSASEASIPVALYNYVGVEKADGSGGGEFGLTIQPASSGGRFVILVYRSIVGLTPPWDFVRDQNGNPIELPAGRTYRLLVATDDNLYKAWLYDETGNQIIYREWRTAVSANGSNQHARRVTSLFTESGTRAYANNNRWREVLVGTPISFHRMTSTDLEGGSPVSQTEPPGNEDIWINVNVIDPYFNEDISINIPA